MLVDLNDRELSIIEAGLVKLIVYSDIKQDKVKELHDKLFKAKFEDIKRNKEEIR